MRFGRNAALALVLVLGLGGVVSAGEVRITFQDGLVTVIAANASVRQVLTEWARLGQTKLVNPERLPDQPLTLELIAVPERRALEVLLRGVPGYIVAARAVPMASLSTFDRILLAPVSSRAPVVTRAAADPPPQPSRINPYSAQAPVVEPFVGTNEEESENSPVRPYGVPRESSAAPGWSSPGFVNTASGGESVYAAATAGFRTGQAGSGTGSTATRPGVSTAPQVVAAPLPYPTTALSQPASATQPGVQTGGSQAARPGAATPVPVPTNPYGMPAIVTPPNPPMVNPYGFPTPAAPAKPPGGGQ